MLNTGAFERRLMTSGKLAIVAAGVFISVLAYWQVFRTDLADEDRNPRVLSEYYDPLRGRILDREGNVLAESYSGGIRRYPDASVAHAVGYLDPSYGSQGIELAYNEVLAGREVSGWLGAFRAEFDRQRRRGHDVMLTLDPAAQAAAAGALGARTGAVIALDPFTGEILAMVSVPTYDPGNLGTFGEQLLQDPNAPLLNRTTQGQYAPGSTFKTVTAIAALATGLMRPDTVVECPGEIVIDGFPVSCRNTPQGVGTYPFRHAFTYSVNAIFAQVGVALGWTALAEKSAELGIGREVRFSLATAPGQLHGPESELDRVLLASTAFGQGELFATPLQLALVAAAIANGGEVVAPRLALAEVRGDTRLRELDAASSRRAFSSEVAAEMQDFMVSVIQAGQASGLDIRGVQVAGKTGTAEAGDGTSHAWFIGYAPADAPKVAIAVVVERAGQGGVVASPIAGAVFRAVIGP
jgi:peptidoglycan glycosyltransferase